LSGENLGKWHITIGKTPYKTVRKWPFFGKILEYKIVPDGLSFRF